jgi:DNA-binding response OmpR family regulator
VRLEQVEQPEQLIDGEQWAAPREDDARQWLSVYDELIALHTRLLTQADLGQLEAERRVPIERSLARLSSRREHWRRWWLNTTGLGYDPLRRILSFGSRHQRLTEREAQIMELFMQHPNATFTSRELVERAWGDEDLSEEQLRTYVVRLRHKLRELGVPGQLRSVARQGYALHLHD